MKSVYMMYSNRIAPGRVADYLKASEEAFLVLNKHVESGLIKDMKILRTLTGDESFAMLAKFDSMADAAIYMDDFNRSGLSLKYQDVQLNTNIQLFEILEDEDVEGIMNTFRLMI